MPYAWTPIAEPRLPPTATMSNPSQLQHQHVNPFSLSLEPPMLYTDLQPIFAEKLTSLYEGCVVITSLKVCHQRVSTCYGCGSSLRENGVLPLPPDDLVIGISFKEKSKQWRDNNIRQAFQRLLQAAYSRCFSLCFQRASALTSSVHKEAN